MKVTFDKTAKVIFLALGAGALMTAGSLSSAATPAASGGGCSFVTVSNNPNGKACISVLSGTTTLRPDGYVSGAGPAGCQAQVLLQHNGIVVSRGSVTACSALHILGVNQTIGSGSYVSIMNVYPHGTANTSGAYPVNSPVETGP